MHSGSCKLLVFFFLNKIFIYLNVCEYLPASHARLVPMEAGRGCWMLWNWRKGTTVSHSVGTRS